jgi:hypothetical protein
MCCGSKRSALRYTSTPIRMPSATRPVSQDAEAPIASGDHIRGAPGPSGAAPGPSASVILRYKETSAIRVRGPVTGRSYDFSIAQPAQHVDPRDAAVLIRSGIFFRA